MTLLVVTSLYIAFLLGYETWAIVTKHETITDHVRDVIRTWSLIGPLVGLVLGGLICHFWGWM